MVNSIEHVVSGSRVENEDHKLCLVWDKASKVCTVKRQVIPSSGGTGHSGGGCEYNELIEDRSGEAAFPVSVHVNCDEEAGISTYERTA